MAQQYAVNFLDQSHVAPPPGSVTTATIPLTFLDVTWLFCPPMKRIHFYELPLPFAQNFITHLKHSLSLTLRHFFPLAGNLTCPPPPNKPYIQYTEGDSVLVTVAESNADFNHLVSNHARDNTTFEILVPELPFPIDPSDNNNTHVVPVMAIQVTIFPNSGISIGVAFYHVAADGRSFSHFMKSWASIHRSAAGEASLSLPCHDKGLIRDPDGLLSIYLNDCWSVENSDGPGESVQGDHVRVTLVLSRDQIDKLKCWVKTQTRAGALPDGPPPLHMSTFVVTSAFMWVNLIKLQESGGRSNDDEIYHFVPVADCRDRFEFPIPSTFFGNCVAFLFVSAKRSELMGKDGIVFAAGAIGRKISELGKGALVGAEKWMSNLNDVVKSGHALAVAGSPKLGVYETDFGWGRPKKIEWAHIGAYGSFSIAECIDEEGAFEIGLVIGREKLDLFHAVFEQSLSFKRKRGEDQGTHNCEYPGTF